MSVYSNRLDPVPALKTQLAEVLIAHLEGLSPEQAGACVGLSRQRIGVIRAGRLEDFSLQRLVRLLHGLGARIAIEVTPPDEARLKEMREEHARQMALVAADRERVRSLAARRRAARRRAR